MMKLSITSMIILAISLISTNAILCFSSCSRECKDKEQGDPCGPDDQARCVPDGNCLACVLFTDEPPPRP